MVRLVSEVLEALRAGGDLGTSEAAVLLGPLDKTQQLELISLAASNDYLSFAGDERLRQAAAQAAQK